MPRPVALAAALCALAVAVAAESLQGSEINSLRRSLRQSQESLDEELFEAVGLTDGSQRKRVADLLRDGANASTCCDIFGNSPLHIAAMKDNHNVVFALIVAGADKEVENSVGDRPMHVAAAAAADQALEVLLEASASVDAQNNAGNTPMHLAFEVGAVKVIRLLLLAESGELDVQNSDGDKPTDVLCRKTCPRGAEKKIQGLLSKAAPSETPVAPVSSEDPLDLELIAVAMEVPSDTSKVEAERLLTAGASPNSCCTQFGGTALHATVSHDNDIVAEVLISNGADVNAVDDLGDTVLHIVSFWNATRVAKLVINSGGDLDALDDIGETPLHHASEFGKLEIATLMVEKGADVDIKNSEGETAEDLICEVECPEDIRLGLEKLFAEAAPAPPTPTAPKVPTRSSPAPQAPSGPPSELDLMLLALAMSEPNDTGNAMATDLIAKGANPNACCGEFDGSALHVTVRHDNDGVAAALIEAGADLNAVDKLEDTPLHIAPFWDAVRVAKLIIDAGPDLNAQDDIGETPLHHAAEFGNVEITRLLLAAGADTEILNLEGEKAVDLICEVPCPPGDEEELRGLFAAAPQEAEADPEEEEKSLDQQLLKIAGSSKAEGAGEKAQSLIDAGASPDACCTGFGGSALHETAAADNKPVAAVLIDAGANVDVRDRLGDTPLHSAAISNAVDVAILLLEGGADVDAIDDIGETPLHRAAAFGRAKVAELLVRYGANATIKNNDGKLPADNICSIPCTAVIEKRLRDLLPETSPQSDKEEEKAHIEEELREIRAENGTAEPPPPPRIRSPPNAFDQSLLDLADTPANDSTRATVMKVLSKGASADACCNAFGGSALHITSNFDNHVVAEALIEAGATVDARDDIGDTPLHDAAIVNAQKVAALLIANGAEIDALDDLDETPLHHAAEWGSVEVAIQLLDAGASVEIESKEGLTPAEVVCETCTAATESTFDELLKPAGKSGPSPDENAPPPKEEEGSGPTFVPLPPSNR
ncbi:unnamed protein product, partial [Ostreobium quekettii]